jgi:ribosomal-protein-alanine N-acetyltransferase
MFDSEILSFPVLTTTRFVLREIDVADAPLIHELRSDPETNALIGRGNSRGLDDAMLHIERIKQNALRNDSFYWIICFQNSSSLVGTIGLWNFDPSTRIAEIGYEVLPSFRGQRIMNEVLPAVIQFGFKNLKLKGITASCSDRNEPSIRLLKKNGFKLSSSPDHATDDPALLGFLLTPVENK